MSISEPDRLIRRASRTRLARAARFIIRAAFFLLPLLFAWLKLRTVGVTEIEQLISNASAADFVWKSALIIYFFAWVWGTLFDVNIQEIVYLEAPDRGKMPFSAIGIAAAIIVVGAVLVWVDSFPRFVGALVVFFVIDHAAWRYLVNFLKPIIQGSQEEYQRGEDFIGMEQLRLVDYQICGSWKWWRGAMGAILIVLMLASALTYLPDQTLAIGRVQISWGFLQASSILFWVLAMELWYWVIRLKTKIAIDALEALRGRYELRQIGPT